MSVRDISRQCKRMGIRINHSTIYRWIASYSKLGSEYVDKIVPRVGDWIRADEAFIKNRGFYRIIFIDTLSLIGMGLSGYTSMSIKDTRYKKIRKDYDKIIGPDTKDTFTTWGTRALELNLARIDYLKKTFPDLAIIKVTENGVVIEDSKNDTVAKITLKNGKPVCSHKGKEAESYLLYATLHPNFHIV